MRVVLIHDDTDRGANMNNLSPEEQECFNASGKAYGVAILDASAIDAEPDTEEFVDAVRLLSDPLDRVYAPSVDAAFHNARLHAQRHGWTVVSEIG